MCRATTRILPLGILFLLLPITVNADLITGSTGLGQPHSNMQPSLAINHIISLQGLFPSRNKDSSTTKGNDPYLGEVSMFAGNFAPRNWALADGQLLPINQNQSLYSLLGNIYGGDGRTTFALPDLRGRTAVHQGQGPGTDNRSLGQKFGAETTMLSTTQMPAHTHAVPLSSPVTSEAGESRPHDIAQPGLALTHTIALTGVYPSQSKGAAPFIGEVKMFAGNFAPRGWAFADGQLLSVSSNDALFSLLGTIYGGDGRTTFALPDLRGRVAVHPGTGPGLSTWSLGQTMGSEKATLSIGQMPAHTHTAVPEPSTLVLALIGLLSIGADRTAPSVDAAMGTIDNATYA